MPTGKHKNHRGGRPKRLYMAKLVSVHFASDDEMNRYMQLSPRQRVAVVMAAQSIVSYDPTNPYFEKLAELK